MNILNFIVAILSLLSIGFLFGSVFIDIDSELYKLLEYFDSILCLFFLGDFIKQFTSEKDKWRYMYTYGWIDLLSSVPVVKEFRYARALRIFRIIRVIKSIKLLVEFFKENKKQTLFGALSLMIVLSIFVCTFLVLMIEEDVGNIQTAEDALWWAFITITTVGYGDFYPITKEGRLIAFFLITNGVISFAIVVSYFESLLNKVKET